MLGKIIADKSQQNGANKIHCVRYVYNAPPCGEKIVVNRSIHREGLVLYGGCHD
jgi:hypothetical protein